MGGDIVLWMLLLLIVFILLGVHIGVSLAMCSAFGVFLIFGSMETAVAILGNTAYEAMDTPVTAAKTVFPLIVAIASRPGKRRIVRSHIR